jgi:hypothetical protein
MIPKENLPYADYNHLWELMNEINIIMWESYMIEGKEFGRTEGYKINVLQLNEVAYSTTNIN